MKLLPSTACKTALAYGPGEPERVLSGAAASADFEWVMSLSVPETKDPFGPRVHEGFDKRF
jgi:hypothetical protein